MRRGLRCSAGAALGLLSALLAAALALTLRRAAHAPYRCEMTYMYPRYDPVDVRGEAGSRYRLLLYRDGGVASHAAGAASVMRTDRRADQAIGKIDRGADQGTGESGAWHLLSTRRAPRR